MIAMSSVPQQTHGRRRNGAHRPFHIYQIGVTAFQLFSAILYYVLVDFVWAGRELGAWIFTIVFTAILFIVVVISAVWTTLVDPVDPHLLDPQLAKSYGDKEDTILTYCPFCETQVMKESKHCHHCAKCVPGRDHHCFYLNNCIGTENMRPFWVLLASIWCTTLNIILSEAIALTFSFKHKEETIEQFQHYFAFDEGRLIFTQVLLCLVLTVTVIAFAQLSYLCLWHINVYRQGTTSTALSKRKRSLELARKATKDSRKTPITSPVERDDELRQRTRTASGDPTSVAQPPGDPLRATPHLD